MCSLPNFSCAGDESSGPVRRFDKLLESVFDHAEEQNLLSESTADGKNIRSAINGARFDGNFAMRNLLCSCHSMEEVRKLYIYFLALNFLLSCSYILR